MVLLRVAFVLSVIGNGALAAEPSSATKEPIERLKEMISDKLPDGWSFRSAPKLRGRESRLVVIYAKPDDRTKPTIYIMISYGDRRTASAGERISVETWISRGYKSASSGSPPGLFLSRGYSPTPRVLGTSVSMKRLP